MTNVDAPSSDVETELGVPSSASIRPPVDAATSSAELVFERSSSSSSSRDVVRVPLSSSRPGARCFVVGRLAATSDLRLDHKSVSRRHAVLYWDGALTLRDLRTKKGTTVNDEAVVPTSTRALRHGDAIRFGTYGAVFRVGIVRKETTKETDEKETETETKIKEEKDENDEQRPALTAREKRQAEIAAMVESLDHAPVYTKYRPEKEDRPPPSASKDVDEDSSSSSSALARDLPVSRSVDLAAHATTRTRVTALAADRSGRRVAVGNLGGTVSLYDFGGMDEAHEPFRTVGAGDANDDTGRDHPVTALCLGGALNGLAVAAGSSGASVLDRDGRDVLARLAKGDGYLADPARMVGHSSEVTAADAHPHEKRVLLTAGADGSARTWDVDDGTNTTFTHHLKCRTVYRVKKRRGAGRAAVNCAAFHPAGRTFAVGTSCGTLQIWRYVPGKRAAAPNRPERILDVGSAVRALAYAPEGDRLATRSDDDVVKAWDPRDRATDAPVLVFPDLPAADPSVSDVAYSPDGRVLCVPTVAPRVGSTAAAGGELRFLDARDGTLLRRVRVDDVAPVVVLWHRASRQILVGLSNGAARVYWSPEFSDARGAAASSARVRQRDALDALLAERRAEDADGSRLLVLRPEDVRVPAAAPRTSKRRRRNDEDDAVNRNLPVAPSKHKIKTGGAGSLTASLMQVVSAKDDANLDRRIVAGKDPREELFRYARKEGERNRFVGRHDDDDRRLATRTAEQDEEDMRRRDGEEDE